MYYYLSGTFLFTLEPLHRSVLLGDQPDPNPEGASASRERLFYIITIIAFYQQSRLPEDRSANWWPCGATEILRLRDVYVGHHQSVCVILYSNILD